MIILNHDDLNHPEITHHNVYTTPIKDEAFLFHKSFYLTYLRLLENNTTLAREYINAIFDYAFYQQSPNNDSDVQMCGFPTIQFQMDVDAGRANL